MNASLGVALFGCGYMGSTAAKALLRQRRLAPFSVELLLVYDPRREHAEAVANECREAWLPTVHEDLQGAVNAVVEAAMTGPVVVYDASPADAHFTNCALLYERWCDRGRCLPLYYVGEKPLVTTVHDLESLRGFDPRFHASCSFTAQYDAVVATARAFLDRLLLPVRQCAWWWACGNAFKASQGLLREGVRGGATLDLAPHVFSMAAELLGRQDAIAFFVDEALCDETLNHGALRTIPGLDEYVYLHAHARDATGRAIPCDALLSWIGLGASASERILRGRLDAFGVPFPSLPADHNLVPPELIEARLGILECDEMTLIMNLLGKRTSFGVVNPWFAAFDRSGALVEQYTIEEDLEDLRATQLLSLFAGLEEDIRTGNTPALQRRRRRAELIHDAVVKAHELAVHAAASRL